jgi:anti-anti-sigma factor
MEAVEVVRGVTVVTLAAKYDTLDEEGVRRLEALLRDRADAADRPLLLLDMRDTVSIGSTFVGALFATDKRLRRRQGQMALCQVGEFCQEVFRVVHTQTLFKTYATRDEALAALTSGPSAS